MAQARARQLQANLPRISIPPLPEKPQSRGGAPGIPAIQQKRMTFSRAVADPMTRLRRSPFMNPAFVPSPNWTFEIAMPAGMAVNKNANVIDEFYRIRDEILQQYPTLQKEFEFNYLKSSIFLDPDHVPSGNWYEDVQLPHEMMRDVYLNPTDDFYRIRHDIFQNYPQLEEIYRDKLNRISLSMARMETRTNSRMREEAEEDLRRSDSSEMRRSEEFFSGYVNDLANSPTYVGKLASSQEFLYFSLPPFENANYWEPNPVNPNEMRYVGPSMDEWLVQREEYLAQHPELRVLKTISLPDEITLDVKPWNIEDLKSSLNEIDTLNKSQKTFAKERLRSLMTVGAQPVDIEQQRRILTRFEIKDELEYISMHITRPLEYDIVNDILQVALEIDSPKDLENVYHYHPDTYFYRVMDMAIRYVHGEIGDADDHFTEDGQQLFRPEDFTDYVRRNL